MTTAKERRKEPRIDRRKHPRVPTNLIIKTKVAANILDMSREGGFIITEVPFAVGEIIEFDMFLPGSRIPMEAEGIVRWASDREPHGIGVEFIGIDAQRQRFIDSFIEGEIRKMDKGKAGK
jgi:hypothetical protein